MAADRPGRPVAGREERRRARASAWCHAGGLPHVRRRPRRLPRALRDGATGPRCRRPGHREDGDGPRARNAAPGQAAGRGRLPSRRRHRVEQALDLLWMLGSFDAFYLAHAGRSLSVDDAADLLSLTAERDALPVTRSAPPARRRSAASRTRRRWCRRRRGGRVPGLDTPASHRQRSEHEQRGTRR